MIDPPDRPRSHTLQRLFAAFAVMAGCLIGGIGLSAIARSGVASTFEEVAAVETETPSPGFGVSVEEAGPAPDLPEELSGAHARRDTSDPGATPIPVAVDPPPSPPPPVSPAPPDMYASPTYGSARLNSGFAPDPYVVRVSAGGSVDANTIGGACGGYIARAPDMRLSYTAGSTPLYISVQSEADTTLVVNAPDGTWHCDDDGGATGLNPLVVFERPQSGQYDVWVGSYAAGASPPATLRISEIGE